VIGGDFFYDGTRRFVSRRSVLTLAADDVFAESQLGLRYRIYPGLGEPGPWIAAAPGTSFTLSGPDGYFVDFQAEDPCHTFADENGADPGDPLPPGPVQTSTLFLGRFGTEKRDLLVGTDGDDVIVGLGGNDVVLGRGGHDLLQGATGDDLLIGHTGDDVLLGHSGSDRAHGHQGDDVLEGGDGDDALHGGPGHDSCDGGPGVNRTVRCEPLAPAASPPARRGRTPVDEPGGGRARPGAARAFPRR
jgi:hypothetical protein